MQVLKLQVPTVAYVQAEHVERVQAEVGHARALFRAVGRGGSAAGAAREGVDAEGADAESNRAGNASKMAGNAPGGAGGVTNMSAEFARSQLWDCVYRRCSRYGRYGRPHDGCPNPVLFPWQHRVSQIWLNKVI